MRAVGPEEVKCRLKMQSFYFVNFCPPFTSLVNQQFIAIPCTQAERTDPRSSQKKNQNHRESTIRSSVICAMRIILTIEEHEVSVIRKHVREQHGRNPSDIDLRFKILRKCQSKFDCFIYEMLFIKELKSTLNKQSDSIRAKLF